MYLQAEAGVSKVSLAITKAALRWEVIQVKEYPLFHPSVNIHSAPPVGAALAQRREG